MIIYLQWLGIVVLSILGLSFAAMVARMAIDIIFDR